VEIRIGPKCNNSHTAQAKAGLKQDSKDLKYTQWKKTGVRAIAPSLPGHTTGTHTKLQIKEIERKAQVDTSKMRHDQLKQQGAAGEAFRK
jgi:hypothetical protein